MVSVVIATYNWGEALQVAIASVLGQTYRDFELLVIGDGCTDDSAKVAMASGDSRIHWQNLPVRVGSQSGPNNQGLRVARGDAVAYLGHDDVWHPDHLASLVETMRSSGADLACSVSTMYGPAGSGILGLAGIFVEGSFRESDFFPPSSMMHTRELGERVGLWRMPEEIVDPVDVDFVRRALAAGAKVVSTERLTTFKFNAAWRRDVYRTRDARDQAALLARLQANAPRFVEEEWAALMRAAREKRLVEVVMPLAEGAAPGQYHRANLLSRGLADREVEELTERRRFLTDSQTSAMDWHLPEGDAAWGTFRWSGPSPVCTWVLPIAAPPAYRLRLQLLNWLAVDVASEVELFAGGERLEFSVTGDGKPALVLEAPVEPNRSGKGPLRVQVRVRKMRCPHFMTNGRSADQRWLGVCLNWMELEPGVPAPAVH